MADAMKPCPCCASAHVDPTGWLANDGQRGPECLACGVTAPDIAAWNRRAPLAPPAEAEVEAAYEAGRVALMDASVGLTLDEWNRVPTRAALAAFVAGRTGGGT